MWQYDVFVEVEIVSKNHVKENMKRIHEIQKSSRRQTDEEQTKQPVKALWKLSKFESVPSRVKEQLQVVHAALSLLICFR